MRSWLVRWIERVTGIDAVRYWREVTLELAKQYKDQLEIHERVIRALTDEVNKLRERAITAEVGLKTEQGTRKMLQNVLAEIGQQTARSDMPRTTLSVISTVAVEATNLAEAWIATGKVDAAEIVNIRATMANRLLPNPLPPSQPRQGANVNALQTERQRTGRVGDTDKVADPKRPHIYMYDPFGPENSLNREGKMCFIPGCNKAATDPIHIRTASSGSMQVERREDDTPPQTLPLDTP